MLVEPLPLKKSDNITGWKLIKGKDVGCQIQLEKNFLIIIPCTCIVNIYLRSKTDTTIKFGIYDRNYFKKLEEHTLEILKDNLNVFEFKFEVRKMTEFSFYIKGDDFDIVLDKKTSFEVVPIETWENPEDLVGDKSHPWKQGQEIVINQDIEKFRFIHITAKKGVLYINKMISPLYMNSIDAWNINIEDKVVLAFTGTNHKTLNIKETHGFEIVNMVGIIC